MSLSVRKRHGVAALVIAALGAVAIGVAVNTDDATSTNTTTSKSSNSTSAPAPSTSSPTPTASTATTSLTSTTDPRSTTSAHASTTSRGGSTTPLPIVEGTLGHAYQQAFDAECQRIWNFSPNHIMVDPNFAAATFKVSDCTSGRHKYADDQFNDFNDAHRQGVVDAIQEANRISSSTKLCWADAAVTRFIGCWDSRRPGQAEGPQPFPTG